MLDRLGRSLLRTCIDGPRTARNLGGGSGAGGLRLELFGTIRGIRTTDSLWSYDESRGVNERITEGGQVLTAGDIAKMAGVTPSAVSNWA